jgi:hypothetical protein
MTLPALKGGVFNGIAPQQTFWLFRKKILAGQQWSVNHALVGQEQSASNSD